MASFVQNVSDRVKSTTRSSSQFDVGELESELQSVVAGEVRFDAGSRALYATDGSNYRQVPIGVVIPRDLNDVVATVAKCREIGAPLVEPWRWHEFGRPVLQCGRCDGLFKIC